MALATLSVDLVAKVASFEADLKRVATTAERQGQRMEAAFGLARAGLAGLFAGLSVGAGAAAFRSIVNGVDALNDLADATGASIENLSALEDAAARTGTGIDTVGDALIKLNQTLSAATPGSNAAKAFEALGLSVKTLKAADPAEALRQVSVAFGGFADDGNKARLAQELFGRSLREVAKLIGDLGTQSALIPTITTASAKATAQFNNQLSALQKNALDVARDLSGPLVSALNDSFAALGRLKKVNPATLFGQELSSELSSLRLTIARTKVEDLTIGLQKDPANTGLSEALRQAREDYAELSRAAAAANEKLKQTLGVPPPLGRRPPNEGGGRLANGELPSLPDIFGGRATSAAKAPVRIDPFVAPEDVAAIKALEGTDLARISALNDQLTGLFNLQRETRGSPVVAEAIAKTRDELEKLDPAAQAAAEQDRRLKALLAATPGGQLQSVVSDIDVINKAFDDGSISTDQWAEAVKVATSKLGTASTELERVSTFAEQAGRNIQDALGSSLEQGIEGNFKNIGKLWGDLLKRMVAQAAAARLNDFLFGSAFGGSGKGSGAIGGLLTTLFGGKFADGGMLGAGKWGIAGERGPELIVGPAQVVPSGALAGGPQVYLTYNINGDVSPQTIALVRGMGASVKADILRSMRVGGAFASS